MKTKLTAGLLLSLLVFSTGAGAAETPEPAANKSAATSAKILIHLTQGPENPTRAALAFLVARTALSEGHPVSLFLAGDAVQLLRDNVLDSLAGLGTGKLREHYDAIVKAGVIGALMISSAFTGFCPVYFMLNKVAPSGAADRLSRVRAARRPV